MNLDFSIKLLKWVGSSLGLTMTEFQPGMQHGPRCDVSLNTASNLCFFTGLCIGKQLWLTAAVLAVRVTQRVWLILCTSSL